MLLKLNSRQIGKGSEEQQITTKKSGGYSAFYRLVPGFDP